MMVLKERLTAPDPACCREDFPILRRSLKGNPLVYLDSAATALKPQMVIDAVLRFYTEYTANVHRAVHRLSEEATEAFEAARARVARFIGAEAREIVFVRHATEALNLVAASTPKDSGVAVSDAEHHSNLLPWRKGRIVRMSVDETGCVDLGRAQADLRRERPGLVAASTIGNAFGTRQPVSELATLARELGAEVLLDVSQSVGHEAVDVGQLDCDYVCFSGHKMLGPSGVGVLWVRSGREAKLRPLLHGGSMVLRVGLDDCELQPHPWCLEAGTPNIEGVLGLAAACDYLDGVGIDKIEQHNQALVSAFRSGLTTIPRIEVNGAKNSPESAITSFCMAGLQAHNIARLLSNRFGIMVRSGYHCAQPLHAVCGLPETVRVSVHLYNTMKEIGACIEALSIISRMP